LKDDKDNEEFQMMKKQMWEEFEEKGIFKVI
jgi:hypothetical protein